ncbi:hypothetical protein [Chromobacterium haemolyticum]|uniref:hypothetical protein n=1 Tax=Chromobacterium haemolyticum TaxID=394935 RepID=UPI0019636D8E|nr:hypothetical protein [Chromobacterium haemolyticum]
MQIFDMNTPEGREAVAAYERMRAERTMEGTQLYAKIKRSSKYYGQAKPHEMFPVFIETQQGEYVVQGGPGGQYRLCDVNLFVAGDDGHALRIS